VHTHLARNAEAGTRQLSWARTGIPSYQYRSAAVRAEEIEAGAGRPAVALVADVSARAAALAEAAAVMPAGAWQHPVTWTSGVDTPAEHVVQSRLGEVLIHHVDLGMDFGPDDWPALFVREMLELAIGALGDMDLGPLAAKLDATDTGWSCQLGGDVADPLHLTGTEASLLAWVLGRPAVARLSSGRPGPLPVLPSIYYL
jgi:maleylpyruvate isomerase